jgi:hypothetical protein
LRLVRIATEKVKPNLFEVDLTDPAISVRGEALVQPMFSWQFLLFWGGNSQTTIATVKSQLQRFSHAAPPPGLQEHQKGLTLVSVTVALN